MKAEERKSNQTSRNTAGESAADTGSDANKTHAPKSAPGFEKVKDGHKLDIRGLWVRNKRYYAQLTVENPLTGKKKVKRVPLIDKDGAAVQTVAQAVAELKRLQTHRADNMLRALGRTPKLADYAKHYLDFISSGQGAKKAGTVEKERTILGRWIDSIGQLRLDQIKRVHVNRFVESRLKEVDKNGHPKVCARTINLDVIGLRVVLKRALSDGLIQRLPTEGLRPLKTSTPKRPQFTAADLERLCSAAFETKTKNSKDDEKAAEQVPVTKNAQQFVDYLRLMAYSGLRRNEALGVQWDDVDFERGQLRVSRQVTHRGIDEDLKNREARTVDFNAKLKAHLEDMASRLAPDSCWLFPSPQRGDKDIPAHSFIESLKMVRAQAKLPCFGFHDLRHYFVSMCVMSGIDFMTIAAWVGHKDGGILIGKVYGHLANEHRQAMAERVSFEPAAVKPVA